MFRRLLVAVDADAATHAALDSVAEVAALARCTLTLVTVVPSLPRFASLCGRDPDVLAAEAQHDGLRVLRGAAARMPAEVPVTTHLRRGVPGAEIVAAAEEHQVDLIVLGSGRRVRLASPWSSVSHYVRAHSRVPVLMVPPASRGAPPPRLMHLIPRANGVASGVAP